MKAPLQSPVWFHWENEQIWVIGSPGQDSFLGRKMRNPKCSIGIVDFDFAKVRFIMQVSEDAMVEKFNKEISYRLLSKYLGPDEESWDPRFQNLDDSNVLIQFTPVTVVVRDISFQPSVLVQE